MVTLDMMNNLNDIMNLAQQLQQNPMKFLSRRFNIPENLNSPNDIIQHLLNSGQVTQTQVNNATQMLNSPMFRNMFNRY